MSLKIAVIPWSDDFLEDSIFIREHVINRDHLMDSFYLMQQEFKKHGDELHTIDMYDDIKEIDWFLFFAWDQKWYRRVEKIKMLHRAIYCNAEPPSVDPINSPKGYQYLKHYFPYILTWNDDWIDNTTIYKRHMMYYFEDNIGNIPYDERKLLTMICGNKSSDYPGELYSERRSAIHFFEQNHPDDFVFYGIGWDKNEHKCYGGRVENKADIYHHFRFAICYENISGLKGYITEKILDCMCAGIVPIYAGAPDICDYVDKDCFINLYDFSDYDQLSEYLINMDEETYDQYLEAGKKYIESDKTKLFRGEQYAIDIYNVIAHPKKFSISLYGYYKRIRNAIGKKIKIKTGR